MKVLKINTPQLREFIRKRYEPQLFTNEKVEVGEEIKLELFDKSDVELIKESDVLNRKYKVKEIKEYDVFSGITVEEIK